jgi:hypothetical protein
VPGVQGPGHALPRIEARSQIKELLIGDIRAEVLAPKGQAELTGQHPRPVSEPARIQGRPLVARGVDDPAAHL